MYAFLIFIEIRYAPVGDENNVIVNNGILFKIEIRYSPVGDENVSEAIKIGEENGIEIRYAPVGDENFGKFFCVIFCTIEIRYAPVGDENRTSWELYRMTGRTLRLDMPR